MPVRSGLTAKEKSYEILNDENNTLCVTFSINEPSCLLILFIQALVHLTFAALDGYHPAQMALVSIIFLKFNQT
jgi:hypothetical protein